MMMCLGAVHLQLDVLAQLGGEVAHDARQFLPGIADRLHARLHDAFLQLGGDVRQALQRHLELGVLVAAHDLQELVAGEHQLRDHGHQVFQRIDVDADRLRRDLAVELVLVALGLGLLRLRLLRGGLGLRLLGNCGSFARGLAEGAFELVERHLARTQRTLQHLLNERSRLLLRLLLDWRGTGAFHCHALELADQVGIGAFRLLLVLLQSAQNVLEAIDGGQDQRDRLAGDRHAVAKLAHERLSRVGERFQPRQAKKSAGPFDRMDEAKDVIEDLGVVGVLLETNELHVDDVEAFVRLGEEFPQEIVHGKFSLWRPARLTA